MPAQYEAMRDKFAQDMSYDAAQGKAARIYNSKHPEAPVTGRSEGGRSTQRQRQMMKKKKK